MAEVLSPESEDLKTLYSIYLDLTNTDITFYTQKKKQLRLPIVPSELLKQILMTVQNIFQSEKLVLQLSAPIVVVGDLHGHILDLFRIIKTMGAPPLNNYLFLGDLIDRGEFSTETCTLVFLMKILFPNNVFIIRGNHEFREITHAAGWGKELYHIYNDESIFDYFTNVFEFIPVAALIDDFMVCVHGGVGENFRSLFQIQDLPRPIKNFENKALCDMLWGDPDPQVTEFGSSYRGLGNTFGLAPTKRFLEDTQVKFLVRGHQCINNGIELSHNGKVITVFSASSYCGTMTNQCGVLNVIDSSRYDVVRLPPAGYLHRYEAYLTAFETCKQLIAKYKEKSFERVQRERRVSVDDFGERKPKRGISKFKSAVDMPRMPIQFSPSTRRQLVMKLKGKYV